MSPRATASQPQRPWQITYHLLLSILFDPQYFYVVAALVLVGDALLTQLIVHFVPCKLVVHPAHDTGMTRSVHRY